ncbi:FecR family protein [Hufsiella ginkgonis]|uniref:DUF4974 domain-containing protein n=1 Tax=Hufsiella ginkgonis TaxID=2695274 RepID=A0A7K1XXP8_9SPHI|nr:FecR domain-containing protein [Hufsiella ginkgonis]MXV15770.1 DUF4974 domain-containing protein [Hufsiella ginkgonis]
MKKFISIEIIRRYLAGSCSQEESEAVSEWFNSYGSVADELVELTPEEREAFEKRLFDQILHDIKNPSIAGPRITSADDAYNETGDTGTGHRRIPYKWFAVAAMLVFAVSLGLYINRSQNAGKPNQAGIPKTAKQPDLLPASNRAVLTLANGETIDLGDAKMGQLPHQGKATILKTREGQIAYHPKSERDADVEYNVMTTPKGSKFELVLADGTKVCLNAASSLRYPTTFTGGQRNVELTGEGYFEVAKNKDKPFNVAFNGVTAQVLGTHFNISAYHDDSFVNTTLLEGSVRIKKDRSVAMLTPGKQAVVENGSDHIVISDANVEEATGWRDGLFVFEHQNIASIMKKVSRWYDVEIVYKGSTKTDQYFSGVFDRSKKVEELLSYLEKLDGARFSKEGRRIVIMN